MTFYVCFPASTTFLGEDLNTQTKDILKAAQFTTADEADKIAIAQGQGAYVIDDVYPHERNLPGPTRYIVTEGNAWALRPGTDLLITCPVSADGSVTWDSDETAELDGDIGADNESAAMAVRAALLALGEGPTAAKPRRLGEVLPHLWLANIHDHDILDMLETDGCAIDCLRVIRIADTLMLSCADLTLVNKRAIVDTVVRQCWTFYFG